MLPDFATRNRPILAIVLQLILAAGSLPAQTTAFTYQGRLQEGAHPADGSYDLQFSLADACSNGNYVATSLTCAAVPVSNGLFAVTLDFGGGIFDGSPRWLEVGVRTNGSSDPYILLSPRQAITAAPYAMFAGGLAPGALITADGAGITNLNGAFIQAGTINSNLLDTATAEQLALAGSAGGGGAEHADEYRSERRNGAAVLGGDESGCEYKSFYALVRARRNNQ